MVLVLAFEKHSGDEQTKDCKMSGYLGTELHIKFLN